MVGIKELGPGDEFGISGVKDFSRFYSHSQR
jgi:hypothetical protein